MSRPVPSPIQNPVVVALQQVTETKRLLEQLVTSSESFDYHNAKKALHLLRRKIRQLARIQSELEAQHPPLTHQVCRVDFRPANPPSRQNTSE